MHRDIGVHLTPFILNGTVLLLFYITCPSRYRIFYHQISKTEPLKFEKYSEFSAFIRSFTIKPVKRHLHPSLTNRFTRQDLHGLAQNGFAHIKKRVYTGDSGKEGRKDSTRIWKKNSINSQSATG